jgi:hypothetical protein
MAAFGFLIDTTSTFVIRPNHLNTQLLIAHLCLPIGFSGILPPLSYESLSDSSMMKTAVYLVHNMPTALRSSCALLGAIRAIRAVRANLVGLLNACKTTNLLDSLNLVKIPARLAQR